MLFRCRPTGVRRRPRKLNQDLTFHIGTVISSIVSDNLQWSTVVKNQAMLTYVYIVSVLFIAATVFLGE